MPRTWLLLLLLCITTPAHPALLWYSSLTEGMGGAVSAFDEPRLPNLHNPAVMVRAGTNLPAFEFSFDPLRFGYYCHEIWNSGFFDKDTADLGETLVEALFMYPILAPALALMLGSRVSVARPDFALRLNPIDQLPAQANGKLRHVSAVSFAWSPAAALPGLSFGAGFQIYDIAEGSLPTTAGFTLGTAWRLERTPLTFSLLFFHAAAAAAEPRAAVDGYLANTLNLGIAWQPAATLRLGLDLRNLADKTLSRFLSPRAGLEWRLQQPAGPLACILQAGAYQALDGKPAASLGVELRAGSWGAESVDPELRSYIFVRYVYRGNDDTATPKPQHGISLGMTIGRE